ncbi:MAG TPA: hypothetical protein DHU96_28205 [Actinobacteria bacterium]|nr:hypothetical protein [Actinomycetota bacterium]
MRLGATSPMIWIDDENEAVNWLWYCSPAYGDEDYVPAARARPAGDASAAAQWRAWQEQLWVGVRPGPSRVRLGAVSSWGEDPPQFVSMSRWPALQAYCQAAWPTFPEWFGEARLKMISPAMAAHLHRAVDQAVQVMGPDQRVRLQIVALTVERALIEEPGRAVIAAGFLRSEDHFGRWLNQFVARSPS